MNETKGVDTSVFVFLNTITAFIDSRALLKYFKIDSYIRIDNYFISPFSLVSIRRGFGKKLVQWEFTSGGWHFIFQQGVKIHLIGEIVPVVKDRKIVSLKIDVSKIECNSMKYYDTLQRYFKCFDTFYFMLTEVDVSMDFLTNPLSINCHLQKHSLQK
ncbi:hypothetical protein NEOKW01_2078 [Nematocida sp. AWRm80]|nr:hypothetical protein NEOKW01_2078 [Nematocida sp. AWRm80]